MWAGPQSRRHPDALPPSVGGALISTFLINHFELFGLQCGRTSAASSATQWRDSREPALLQDRPPSSSCRLVPDLLGHPDHDPRPPGLAAGSSAYHPSSDPLEERDLIRAHPEYAEYRRRVPR